MVDLEGTAISNTERELLLKPEVGGVILFTRNFDSVEQITDLVDEIHNLRTPVPAPDGVPYHAFQEEM